MRTRSVLLSVLTVLAPTAGAIGVGQTPAGAQVVSSAPHSAVQHAAVQQSGARSAHGESHALAGLVGLVDKRLELAETVAAAKWGTHGAIDDPPREQVVLDAAVAGSIKRGIDPGVSKVVFRDQIEASKAVQYGLFSHWSAVPEDAPTTIPDLGAIRPVLDQITEGLLDSLAATQHIRTAAVCRAEVLALRTRVEITRHFDASHRQALGRALRSVCR
ncbi:MAG TPA: chorismate mutase [Mycobacteriales bacterium]|nr:chorismate mutase [Mycobacteriales bacterium]